MKKSKLILLLFALLCSALLIVSCSDEADGFGQGDVDGPVHTHSYEAVVTEPTCTTEGFTTYTCECGDSYVGDNVPITHDYTSHSKVKTPATCEEPGVKELFCQCGASITEEIPSTGHTYTRSKTISTLSCTTDGVTEKYCSCGHMETITVKSEGHKLETTTVLPTCTEDGLTSTKCLNCIGAKSEEILYAAHKIGDDGKCTVCSKSIWNGAADKSWYSDSESSFTISTPAQLAGFAALVNAGNDFRGKTVKLGADIYLGDCDWTAIGNSDKPFAGIFDGANHTVSGFIYRAIDNQLLGFFGFNEGTVKNLNVADCRVRINSQLYNTGKVNQIHFGAVAAYNKGNVDNCSADVDVKIKLKGGLYVSFWADFAAIVGDNYSPGIVSNCTASGSIDFDGSYIESLQLNIGGAVACGYSSSTIATSSSSVDVSFNNLNSTNNNSSYLYMGSFIGFSSGMVNSCTATGNVVSKHTVYSARGYDVYIGGFAGYSEGGIMQNCSATGNVSHSTDASGENNYVKAAGFIGYTSGGISRCYATGNVTVNAGEHSHSVAGGFAGQIHGVVVSECYSIGDVNNVSLLETISGGFAGYISYNGILRNCYSTGNVHQETNGPSSGETTYAGGLLGMLVGQVINCYSTGNVKVICGGNYYAIGASFIGKAADSTISASFCTGDVYAKGVMKVSKYSYNKAGTIVGESSLTQIEKCYYRKDMDLTTYNSANISFSPSGNPLGLGSFMTITFIEQTLGWSADIWKASDESLPTLSAFD